MLSPDCFDEPFCDSGAGIGVCGASAGRFSDAKDELWEREVGVLGGLFGEDGRGGNAYRGN